MIELDKKDISRLKRLIDDADRIAITSHMSPDGDAVGSTQALRHVLRALGKKVDVIYPDEYSRQLAFLPGVRDSIICSRDHARASEVMQSAQLVMCLDYNGLKRIDRMAPVLQSSTAPRVLIDHHIDPEDFCDVVISRPHASSTCYLLFHVLCALELYPVIDLDAATCLMAGMMTDTGNFSYNANDPGIYSVLGRLMEKGVDHDELARLLFDVFSENCLRINGYAISQKLQVWKEYGAALITLTRDELNRYHYSKGDTEGLVNKPLAIPAVQYSCFLREEERYIKVSMRSLGDFPVNEICTKYFKGGGHRNAAGGEFIGSMAQAIEVFKAILPENRDLYLNPSKK